MVKTILLIRQTKRKVGRRLALGFKTFSGLGSVNLPFPADAWPGKVQKETAHFRSWGLCSPLLVMKAVFGVTLLTWGSAQRSNWCQLGFGLHLNLNIKLQRSPRSLYFVGSPGLVSAVVKPTKNKFRRELISSCSLESMLKAPGQEPEEDS